MRRSTGFGSNPCNLSPYSDSVSLRLHLFRFNLAAKTDSPTHYAKGTLLCIPHCCGVALHPLVDTRFQFLFHSPHRGSFHLSLTVLCAIGRQVVFSLGRWSSLFHAGFLVSCATLVPPPLFDNFDYGTITLYGFFSNKFVYRLFGLMGGPQPRRYYDRRFGLLPVRSPLLGKSLLIYFPPVTEMFHFTGLAPVGYVFT